MSDILLHETERYLDDDEWRKLSIIPKVTAHIAPEGLLLHIIYGNVNPTLKTSILGQSKLTDVVFRITNPRPWTIFQHKTWFKMRWAWSTPARQQRTLGLVGLRSEFTGMVVIGSDERVFFSEEADIVHMKMFNV